MSGGGARVSIPAGVRRTIQNIKEIAGNHSDEEVYATLKECSMDPNETAQKLLLQVRLCIECARHDDYIQQKKEGKLKFESNKDNILTKALDVKENAGRARTIGDHITPSVYFQIGRQCRGADVIQDIINEHKKDLLEAKQKISEPDGRIQKLEAMVYKSGVTNADINDKGSCSVRLHPMQIDDMKIDDDMEIMEAAAILQNCMGVAIDEAVDKSAPLPFKITGECEVIGDTIGTHVAWPQDLIVMKDEGFEII